MGRRRKSRKKLLLKPKKTLPKIFTCPHCGAPLVNVKIDRKEGKVLVNCGNCGLEAEFNYIPGLLPVDYFNKFVDLYYQGQIKPKKEVTVSLSQLTTKANPLLDEEQGQEAQESTEPFSEGGEEFSEGGAEEVYGEESEYSEDIGYTEE
ncbi:hypothetical protein [Vulcanisaeta distributa]|uniref:Transcription elongation factor n=1 Tax=Vulcanisaeta distributa (strain DSM 14429 / JCM 11212 / NBRC 100878 / IC-017) TaxID=572478 RepID=E1QNR3_VULDI|nr:hypothetical protein [Vulcanisaeta distributa]ADN50159.1 Protein of unknown function DUF701, zinc-binding protein [Vulcanisaeta distributa DSM 14429]